MIDLPWISTQCPSEPRGASCQPYPADDAGQVDGSQRTGLNVHIIRIWERRYGAVSPARTPTKRRLYAQCDIDRLVLLRRAVDAGHSIGQIARWTEEQLHEILGGHEQAPQTHARSGQTAEHTGQEQTVAHTHLENCLTEVQHFSSAGLDVALARASVALSQPVLIDLVLAPLLDEIGRLWCMGKFRIAHERLASTIVRTFLGGLKNLHHSHHLPASAPRLLVTTPQGQQHELGALMAAVTASTQGWHVTYLGPNLPAEEIAAGALQNNVRAVALSLIYPADDPLLEKELRKLRRLLGPDISLIIGGRASGNYETTLADIGAIRMESVAAFRTSLEAIRLGKAGGPGSKPPHDPPHSSKIA